MNPEALRLVEHSFGRIVLKPTFSTTFYAKLFEIDPLLQERFGDSLLAQGRKLMSALGLAVGNLRNADLLWESLAHLGRIHAARGVTDQQFDHFRTALIWSLEKELGSDFTPDVADAWWEAFALIRWAMTHQALESQPRAGLVPCNT